jgi:hypothetical protein
MKQIIAVRLAPDDVQRLRAIADENNRSISYVSRVMITEGLNRYEQTKGNKRLKERLETGANLLPILEPKQAPANGSSNS